MYFTWTCDLADAPPLVARAGVDPGVGRPVVPLEHHVPLPPLAHAERKPGGPQVGGADRSPVLRVPHPFVASGGTGADADSWIVPSEVIPAGDLAKAYEMVISTSVLQFGLA